MGEEGMTRGNGTKTYDTDMGWKFPKEGIDMAYRDLAIRNWCECGDVALGTE